MDAGLINTIVGSATNLTGSFLNFGAGIYAANHQPIPNMGEFNYQINLPQQPSNSGSTLQTVAIAVVLLVIVLAGTYLVVKKA